MRNNLRNDIKREKTNKFHSMAQAIRSQIYQSLSKPRKSLKGSNGPCDLGPKQDQTKFEWREEQSPKNRSETVKIH